MPARPTRCFSAGLAALAVLMGSAACGAGGQPDALQACQTFSRATTGVVSGSARDALLAEAQRWAAKAADAGPQWGSLLTAIDRYRRAAGQHPPGAATSPRSATRAQIQVSCGAAARGY